LPSIMFISYIVNFLNFQKKICTYSLVMNFSRHVRDARACSHNGKYVNFQRLT
jgi:hypothetical protein